MTKKGRQLSRKAQAKQQLAKLPVKVKVFVPDENALGSAPRCEVCGSKIKLDDPAKRPKKHGMPWPKDKEWPIGAFRAQCAKCGGHVVVLPNGDLRALEGTDMWRNLAPELPSICDSRIQQRDGIPTIVLVGTSPDSCGLTPWDEPGILGFWGLNDCHVLPFLREDKMTRWYQLHFRWRFTRRSLRYGENDHWAWLQKEHPFPILMQKKYEDVPSSAEFPLKELSQRFLLRKIGRGAGFQRKYYTCSFSYVMADAIAYMEDNYKPKDFNPLNDPPYARIEMYGIELAQQIEYIMQRPGTEFWSGLAMGRGIQIYVPPKCRLFQGAMYGYRWPDREEAIAEVIHAHKNEKIIISREEAIKKAVGENVPDEDNVGDWKGYPDSNEVSMFPNPFMDDPYEEEEEMTAPFEQGAAESAGADN